MRGAGASAARRAAAVLSVPATQCAVSAAAPAAPGRALRRPRCDFEGTSGALGKCPGWARFVLGSSLGPSWHPQQVTLCPQEDTLGPQEDTLGPQEVTLGPQEVTLGPQEVTSCPQEVISGGCGMSIQDLYKIYTFRLPRGT